MIDILTYPELKKFSKQYFGTTEIAKHMGIILINGIPQIKIANSWFTVNENGNLIKLEQ